MAFWYSGWLIGIDQYKRTLIHFAYETKPNEKKLLNLKISIKSGFMKLVSAINRCLLRVAIWFTNLSIEYQVNEIGLSTILMSDDQWQHENGGIAKRQINLRNGKENQTTTTTKAHTHTHTNYFTSWSCLKEKKYWRNEYSLPTAIIWTVQRCKLTWGERTEKNIETIMQKKKNWIYEEKKNALAYTVLCLLCRLHVIKCNNLFDILSPTCTAPAWLHCKYHNFCSGF